MSWKSSIFLTELNEHWYCDTSDWSYTVEFLSHRYKDEKYIRTITVLDSSALGKELNKLLNITKTNHKCLFEDLTCSWVHDYDKHIFEFNKGIYNVEDMEDSYIDKNGDEQRFIVVEIPVKTPLCGFLYKLQHGHKFREDM